MAYQPTVNKPSAPVAPKSPTGQSGGKSSNIPLITGSNQIVNALQASFDAAATYTVQFFVTPPTAPGSKGAYGAEAVISWMLEGNHISRRVSVGNGVSISGTAQGVQVQLQDKTIPTAFHTAGAPYSVTVSVTPGVRAAIFPVTLEEEFTAPFRAANKTLGISGPDTNIVIPIPQDAGVTAIQVLGVSTAADPTVKPLLVVDMGTEGYSSKAFAVPPDPAWIPVPANATFVRINNFDITNPVVIAVTWAIDG